VVRASAVGREARRPNVTPSGWWQEIQALRLTKAELGEQLEW
jgi:hypothetical protein